MGNTLAVTGEGARAGKITHEHGARIAAALPSAFSNLVGSASLATRALEIPSHHDHAVYDSLYIALAELNQSQLVTTDDRLVRAVGNTEWEPLVLRLADD